MSHLQLIKPYLHWFSEKISPQPTDYHLIARGFQSYHSHYFYRTRVRSLGMLVSDSLTNCRLVNLIDVTLACEDSYSKLVEVVTVADVSDDDRDGNSLLQIWKLRFGHKA